MSNLNLTDDLNAIGAVVCEAKSITDMTAKYLEYLEDITDSKLQLMYAVDAISRILSIADVNLGKLAARYSQETGDKFASIIYNELELTK